MEGEGGRGGDGNRDKDEEKRGGKKKVTEQSTRRIMWDV